jgi:hypothetical protein
MKYLNRNSKVVLATVVGFATLTALVYGLNAFFNNNKVVLKSPIVIVSPISIEKREDLSVVIVEQKSPLSEWDTYLCKVFKDQCGVALTIRGKENSRGSCTAWNVNTDGSIDLGYMQINSVHMTKDITVATLVDCKSNIDIAYAIYLKDGWTRWSTYK